MNAKPANCILLFENVMIKTDEITRQHNDLMYCALSLFP